MGKSLKTIEEHNEEILKRACSDGLSGISCPECAAEMVNIKPHISLLSNPPQHWVRCDKCKFAGTVY